MSHRDTSIPDEVDATPDEAFELGKVAGYDLGFADGLLAGVTRVVTTFEELDALPVGAVIRDNNGDVMVIAGTTAGNHGATQIDAIGIFSMSWVVLPATVLFETSND